MASFLSNLKALGKAVLLSRRTGFPKAKGARIIIMGNGPSLAETIASHRQLMKDTPLMAVNFAANAPEFFALRPQYYLLADPHFFKNSSDPNVSRLIENLKKADWGMTLFVPFPALNLIGQLSGNKINVAGFNMIGADGCGHLCRRLYRSSRAMPRPRNVIIPAMMTAMAMGYSEIYLTGADHTWIQTLSVDENNRVVSIQPHFYKEDDEEIKRVRRTYVDIPLHSVLDSLSMALKSYRDVDRFARSVGADIYNATPVSLIDAFRRRPLPEK